MFRDKVPKLPIGTPYGANSKYQIKKININNQTFVISFLLFVIPVCRRHGICYLLFCAYELFVICLLTLVFCYLMLLYNLHLNPIKRYLPASPQLLFHLTLKILKYLFEYLISKYIWYVMSHSFHPESIGIRNQFSTSPSMFNRYHRVRCPMND